jgi:hypothetical protein
METDFTAIRDGLRRLRETTAPLKVFGLESHGFCTHPPLVEQTVRDFEAQHRVTLPPEYRGFLIHVGNGGAGPAYGLFKLGEMDNGSGHKVWTEVVDFVGVLARPFPHTGSWNDLTEEPVYDQARDNDAEWEEEYHRQLDAWENRV